jgi:carbon storage regulator
MLVLSRRVGETISIGDSIRLTVLVAQSGKLRIGIDAPRELGIVRDNAVIKVPSPTGAAPIRKAK